MESARENSVYEPSKETSKKSELHVGALSEENEECADKKGCHECDCEGKQISCIGRESV